MRPHIALALIAAAALSQYCGEKGEQKNAASPKGVGPVKEVQIGATVDAAMASEGAKIFQTKCSACHETGARKVGPAMYEVTKRRAPEWIMNMILNPEEMTKVDPQAQELLATYLAQMTFQNVTQDDARKILEFFRDTDSKPLKTAK
ncbi:MAG: cytochrome c [Spirochaetes bacterium]|nr:cytochrome c [Spirochaetota bacterium]